VQSPGTACVDTGLPALGGTGPVRVCVETRSIEEEESR
jgi:hypothetical protein